MSLERGQSSGTPLSCRAPGYQGSWPHVAPFQGTGGSFPGQPLHGGPMIALLHAGRAAVLMRTSPHYPGAGREVLVGLLTSLIATGDVLWACLSGTRHQHWPRPGPPRTGHHPLHLSLWEQVCRWNRSLCWAHWSWLCFLLGDLAGLTRGNLRPPRQCYPCQVGTLVELALPSYQSVIIAAPLNPPCEIT